MAKRRIVIDALWDAEAGVFVATSHDVPGLVAEAATVEALSAKLDALVPELLELNAVDGFEPSTEVELVLLAERRSTVRPPTPDAGLHAARFPLSLRERVGVRERHACARPWRALAVPPRCRGLVTACSLQACGSLTPALSRKRERGKRRPYGAG